MRAGGRPCRDGAAPRLVAGHVARPPGTRIGGRAITRRRCAPGERSTLRDVRHGVHRGDHFAPLDAYRRILAERGLAHATCPPRLRTDLVRLGLRAQLHHRPGLRNAAQGEGARPRMGGARRRLADLGGRLEARPRQIPARRRRHERVRRSDQGGGHETELWLAPLAADPGTDLLRDHADMLLLDKNGAAQDVSWWDAFICVRPIRRRSTTAGRRSAGSSATGAIDGLKLDGQHLNGVAPCYNPAHNHARPEESFEKLQDFWKALYDEAIAINPDAVIEICPCGTSFAFHNIPAMNQTPASDPKSSWQMRQKGKTFKALMGPSAPYAGDHVELSDGANDFASTLRHRRGALDQVHLAAGSETRSDSFLLAAGTATEAQWRKWIALYREAAAEGRVSRRASTTSASTSRRPMRSRRTADAITPSSPTAGAARLSCAGSAPDATG